MNLDTPTYASSNGSCSVIDLCLCSPDNYAKTIIQVEEELYDSDHFPIIISVELYTQSRHSPIFNKWPNMCREIDANLQWVSSITNESFYRMIHSAMNKYSTSQTPPSLVEHTFQQFPQAFFFSEEIPRIGILRIPD